MMDVIYDSVLIAARFGAQVGAQLEIDRTIHAWERHAEILKYECDKANREADKFRIIAKALQDELDEVRAQLEGRTHELSAALKKIQSGTVKLATSNEKIAKLEKNILALKFQNVQSFAESQKKCKALLDLISKERTENSRENMRLKDVIKNLQRYLIATRARLVGSERIYGVLVAEIVEAGQFSSYPSLNEKSRRKILVSSWNAVVNASAQYAPPICFTYDPIPIN